MILGVDPGARGACALLRDDGRLAALADMPALAVTRGGRARLRVAPQVLAALLREWHPRHAFVERVGSMPGQGVASAFAFGAAVGVVEGVLAALAIPVTFCPPAVWKRALALPAGAADHPRGGERLGTPGAWTGTPPFFRACELNFETRRSFFRPKKEGGPGARFVAFPPAGWPRQTPRTPLRARAVFTEP